MICKRKEMGKICRIKLQNTSNGYVERVEIKSAVLMDTHIYIYIERERERCELFLLLIGLCRRHLYQN